MGPNHLCLKFEFQMNLQFYNIIFNGACKYDNRSEAIVFNKFVMGISDNSIQFKYYFLNRYQLSHRFISSELCCTKKVEFGQIP